DDDGAVLAEFRDDAVTAQALGGPDANDPAPMAWREWDVELATGDRALLKLSRSGLPVPVACRQRGRRSWPGHCKDGYLRSPTRSRNRRARRARPEASS